MNAMKFFFEFFLEEKCEGNKSLCARELSLHDRAGIHKALKRFDSGGGIGSTAANLIERLIERNVSLDWLAQCYIMAREDAAERLTLCPRMATLDAARERWRQSRGTMLYCGKEVCGKLDDVAEQMIYVYCMQNRCPGDASILEGQCVCDQLAGIIRQMCETFGEIDCKAACDET